MVVKMYLHFFRFIKSSLNDVEATNIGLLIRSSFASLTRNNYQAAVHPLYHNSIFYISFMGWVKLPYGTVVILPI